MDPTRGDSRYNLNYPMSGIGLSLADQADLYGGNPATVSALGGRPPSGGLIQPMGGGAGVGFSSRASGLMPNSTQCQSLVSGAGNSTGGHSSQQRGIKRAGSDCYEDHHRSSSTTGMSTQSLQGLDCVGGSAQQSAQQQQQQQQQQQSQVSGNVPDVVDDSYTALQNKKSPPANGKKTKGRVKIKMEYIDNKLRRYTTFSKRKTGIMKKAYELSTLTGTQVMLLVASETGHVYTFATRKLQPMITSEAGKQLIQTCLNSPDPPSVGGGDQRMSATGFEETELSYNIADEDSKEDRSPLSSGNESDDSSDAESPVPAQLQAVKNSALTDARTQDNSKQQAAAVTVTPSTSGGASTSAMTNKNVAYAIAEDLTHNATVAEPKLKHNTNIVQQERQPLSAECLTSYAAPSGLTGLPQDMLLKLIQSGHLQLHTEEDGSGQQYISIPLTSNAAQTLKSPKEPSTRTGNIETAKDMRMKDMKSAQSTAKAAPSNSNSGVAAIAGLPIKQELE
uniref:Serum response factor homolog n=1 Tax=Bactrocera latifrons TaxID=174628 RepID=A0A0K8U015_BACLA